MCVLFCLFFLFVMFFCGFRFFFFFFFFCLPPRQHSSATPARVINSETRGRDFDPKQKSLVEVLIYFWTVATALITPLQVQGPIFLPPALPTTVPSQLCGQEVT